MAAPELENPAQNNAGENSNEVNLEEIIKIIYEMRKIRETLEQLKQEDLNSVKKLIVKIDNQVKKLKQLIDERDDLPVMKMDISSLANLTQTLVNKIVNQEIKIETLFLLITDLVKLVTEIKTKLEIKYNIDMSAEEIYKLARDIAYDVDDFIYFLYSYLNN
ncbi:hypothetical protein STSV2_01 [Sulfolobus virus STSV2]|uniref:hypothetical protein n=1 Tax=Sulfolobus virus STSV2 TaxID=1123964 RepID=UPI0002A8366C|nr:hypothetical protein STSV2_01 [Sulfolobus virus STSV2]AFU91980.1 hypothetical protein STSV2_01 [Sulfolobus virus STSV2]